MTYQEVVSQIEELASAGKLKNQKVEVVLNDKKYFIHHLDISSDKVMLKVDRSHYHPLGHQSFLHQLKDVNDMVNPSATVEIHELDKSGDGHAVSSVFCSPSFIEVVG